MIKTSVLGQSELVARMQRVRDNVKDTLLAGDVERLLLLRVRRRFEASTSPDGGAWPALAASTIRRKKYLGVARPEKALERTGALRDSIGVIPGVTDGLIVFNTGFGFRIGVRDPDVALYGRLHNEGIGQRQRRFLGMSSGDVGAIRVAAARKLKAITSRNGV